LRWIDWGIVWGLGQSQVTSFHKEFKQAISNVEDGGHQESHHVFHFESSGFGLGVVCSTPLTLSGGRGAH